MMFVYRFERDFHMKAVIFVLLFFGCQAYLKYIVHSENFEDCHIRVIAGKQSVFFSLLNTNKHGIVQIGVKDGGTFGLRKIYRKVELSLINYRLNRACP
jgi:hypothetical protein